MPVQTTFTTTPTAAISGQLADNSANECLPRYNEEASAEVKFGAAVKFGTTDYGALLPAAETDKIIGIVIHSHAYTKGFTGAELGDTGVKPKGNLSVLRRGRVWVICRSGCVPGDRLWVRCTAAPGVVGDLENADDGTETIDCTNQGQWLTTASAGALALLEVDFTADAT